MLLFEGIRLGSNRFGKLCCRLVRSFHIAALEIHDALRVEVPALQVCFHGFWKLRSKQHYHR